MDFARIDRVGIELEGGWATRPGNAAHHPDGSVRIQYGTNGATVIGEMVSAPISDWQTISDWIFTTYPAAHNSSCGMHVHVSFKNRRDYARLMDPQFFEYFQERMRTWGTRVGLPASHLFWTRLDGFNTFCRKAFLPDQQAAIRSKHRSGGVRYTQLNYCFKVHGTIECRLFPVFKQPRIAASAVQELLSIYEDYLRDNDYVTVVERIDDLM
jgi:hypothetical protein